MTSCENNNTDTSEESKKDVSDEISDETSDETSGTPGENDNLAYHAPYFYDCGIIITGDNNLVFLTDGDDNTFAELTTSLDKGNGYTITATDWSGKTHNLTIDNTTAAISVDLGFMSEITGFEVTFGEYSGEKCDIFYSTDGYNFSFYAGSYGVYEDGKLSDSLSITAKAVMFVFPVSYDKTIKIGEIRIKGDRRHNRTLLTAGASYEIIGTVTKKYPELENGYKLTDGKTFITDGDEALLGFVTPTQTVSYGSAIVIDLGDVKNVSEVYFGLYITSSSLPLPEKVNVKYSRDNENWEDFGQSYLTSSSNITRTTSNKYLVTRPYTVKARYIKVITNISTSVITDEIFVYGSETDVEEPDYNFINRKNQLSNTNVASFVKATLNGNESSLITDLAYREGLKGVEGENEIKLTLNKTYDDLCGATVTYEGQVNDFELFCGEEKVSCQSYTAKAGSNTNLYIFFDDKTSDNVTIKLTAGNTLKLKEASVYAGQPQLPLIRGGFFQLPTNGGRASAAASQSEYAWYLQLKGMKDLGMDWVVMQYTVHYNAKSTMVNGPKITAAGYAYSPTYGCDDVFEAVLSAADRLGMKVFLGTIHDSDFTSPNAAATKKQYENIVKDSFLIIEDIYNMYHHHTSFAGYYLSDEECDQWLNMSGGVNAGRYVYKNQSDYIHEIAPEALIMIAPAIWRSGKPITGADNLYRLIAPDKEGDRPVADIVAAQDCLGRTSTLYVEDSVMDSFEDYVTEWAKAVRRAGAEFWHDMEIFEQVSTTKRYDEIVKSLVAEAKMSGSIIVFDIPHYFTTFPMTKYDSVFDYYKRLIVRDYVKFYSTFATVDGHGKEAEPPEVVTDDGRKVDMSGVIEVTKPEIKDEIYNEGVLIKTTPSLNNSDSLNWQNFALGNIKATPEYAYAWDNNNFYALVRTNDDTVNYGAGVWWESKDDLVQVWMITTGATNSTALENDHGIRYYLHRTSSGWTAGGEGASAVTIDGFTFEEKDGVILITMPWSSLGRTVPTSGDGTAMGIKIQYVDGEDDSWASSNGSKDQSINTNALYSY